MGDTMRKLVWGFREREPLKSVVIHGSGYACLICENISPTSHIALFEPFYTLRLNVKMS